MQHMRFIHRHTAPILVPAVLFWFASLAMAAPIDFNRQVRPILASKCFNCHGPDDSSRKGALRLDLREAALKPAKSGKSAIVRGDPARSELLKRLTCDDDDDVMPPPKAGARLAPQAIDTLKQWIAQGAPYAVHWSYAPITPPAIPQIKNPAAAINDIDRFILARLDREDLAPAPRADRHALIRRLSLDLIGLPPTIARADAFAADNRPDAYQRLVDELLASPAFGERWATVWLDLARYADSQGFAPDQDRTIWRYRDWVIGALNDNMPFDRFTIEQLAGDLLPQPTTSQLIATGFHRNTLTNTEGGTNDEEFRVAAVLDRVNTTMQAWMASTFVCAQCHNHKYDPISQKEFYQVYAIFNNTLDNDQPNEAPTIEVPRAGMEGRFDELKGLLAPLKTRLDAQTRTVDLTRAAWEKSVDPKSLPRDIAAILGKSDKERDKKQKERLADYHRSLSPDWKAFDAEHRKLNNEFKAISTTAPVMREGPERQSHILLRGDFLNPGEKVSPGLPATFPQPAKAQPINRLALAQWLVSPENPLTARVAANRLWEELFGVGIVETSEEFGMQGELPSHPELLDYLASQYIQNRWDTKKLIRLIVTSATYRQGSAVSSALAQRDPNNRLLARGPRVRLGGEAIRDQALFAAGLLSPKMFGPPCQPPKPNMGLSAAFGPAMDWKSDINEDRWRRGLYIRIRRNSPYPSLTTFDAPERTTCTIRRIRTNTPLQALVTLNDPCFIEAAQGLAVRSLKEAGPAPADRVGYAFRCVLTRPPTAQEAARLVMLFQQARAEFSKDPKRAAAIGVNPLIPAPPGTDPSDLAAWTVVSNVILNLDEAIAKR